MKFKLIMAMVNDDVTDTIADAARQAGATGMTQINQASGEGLKPKKTFLGLNLEMHRDILIFVVEEHRARDVLETIAKAGQFDETPGTGIALQIDIEDAVGVAHQVAEISKQIEEEL